MLHRFLKLVRMPWGEIAGRVGSLAREKTDEALYRLHRGKASRPAVRWERGRDGNGSLLDPAGIPALCDEIRQRHAAYARDLAAQADEIRAHRFTFLGHRVEFGPEIPWQTDPRTGKPWPARYHGHIDIFGGAQATAGQAAAGDVKYVWEVNRHQYLPILARAAVLTGDARYADECLALMESWIRANPYLSGINWTSALEVAVRAMAWLESLALLRGGTSAPFKPSRERLGPILEALHFHGLYLARHLSFYFSPYNHLIGEAAALHAIGAGAPELDAAAGWEDLGWRVLVDEVERQFHADGGTVEQASGYHFFTVGFYVHALLVRRGRGRDVPARLRARLERAFEWAMHLSLPSGSLPMIGDGDEGKALVLAQPSLWDFRPYLALGAALFERPDFKFAAGEFPPDLLWLVGLDGLRRYEALKAAEPAGTVRLGESGYAVQRSGWRPDAHCLILDAGEIAAGVGTGDEPSAAHGHADTLSIEVSSFGAPAIVDPGFYTYNGDIAWHRHFRDSAAHNTIVVDGQSQADFRGRLKWSGAPVVRPPRAVSAAGFDCAEGSFRQLRTGIEVRRRVLFVRPDYWLLLDEVFGPEGDSAEHTVEHTVERYFHFAPSEAAVLAGRRAVSVRMREAGLLVQALEDGAGDPEILVAGDGPTGWIAVGYEQKLRAPAARFSARLRLPATLLTALRPFRNDPQPIESLCAKVDAGEDRIFFGKNAAGVTDALLALVRLDMVRRDTVPRDTVRRDTVRRDGSGSWTSAALLDGSQIVWEGAKLLPEGAKRSFAAVGRSENESGTPRGGLPVLEVRQTP